MKLGDILYEATDYDAIRDQMDKPYIDGKAVTNSDDVYEVDFTLFDEDGEEVKITGNATSYPDMVEIEVSDIESWDNNPNPKSEDDQDIEYNYDDATVELTSSADKSIKAWLSTSDDYVEIIDYEFDIDYEKQTGSVTATAVKK